MRVSVQSGEGLERRMTVELPVEAINQEVEKRLKDMARKVRMDGFRPGKVPVKIVRTRYASQVQREVFEELVQSSFPAAVAQEQLHLANAPRIEPSVEQNQDQGHFAYTAVFEVLPEIQLAALESYTIRRPVADVADADIDAMLEQLRQQRQTWRRVEEPAQLGHQVLVSFKGTIEGEPLQNGEAKDLPLVLGSHSMIDGFEDGLVGASAGETRVLELSFPADYQVATLAGRPVVFEVSIGQVAEAVLPEVDAEFVKSFDIESGEIEALRTALRQNMQGELTRRVHAKVKQQVLDALFDAHNVQLPKALVSEEIDILRKRLQKGLQEGGTMPLPDQLFEEEAQRRIALRLIIGEVVRQNDIKVDGARVQQAIQELAATYEDPTGVVRHYNDPKQRAAIEAVVLEDQVVDWVLEQAQVEAVPSSFKEVTAPVPESPAPERLDAASGAV